VVFRSCVNQPDVEGAMVMKNKRKEEKQAQVNDMVLWTGFWRLMLVGRDNPEGDCFLVSAVLREGLYVNPF
jgi:hypothetical protein